MASLASARELHSEGARFAKVGPLETSVSMTSYREAGSNLVIKDPDQVDYANITLETGASQSAFFYNWTNNIARSLAGLTDGLPVAIDKRNLTIYQYNRERKVVKKIQLYGAFPIQFHAGEWDNNEDKVVIERLVLAYDFFDMESRSGNSP